MVHKRQSVRPDRPTITGRRPVTNYVLAMGVLSGMSLVLFAIGVLRGNGFGDWYLVWNLFLAWIPLGLAYALVRRLRSDLWSSWSNIAISLAWLLFLPNSFYMVSDYIHLADMVRENVLFDSLTFTTFILNALVLGYTSLFLVQVELRKRFNHWQVSGIVSLLLVLCSFAIYLGRDLRWNSWDVLVNPAGIIFDVSERLIDPLGHPDAFQVTGIFFLFLAGLYVAIGLMARAAADYARRQD